MKIGAWFRLMRVDKPIGFVLLWAPTAWALELAAGGMPSWRLLFYFFLGTLCMRSAGCVVNDMADRHFDGHVERTRHRPLATGELGLFEALCVLGVLLSVAAWVVLQLPQRCLGYALLALLVTILYPFTKRFFFAPQWVLGVAFSMGIPMAYVATDVALDGSMWGLFVLNMVWILAYDTTYALIDREDDRHLGIHSTALLFEPYERLILALLLSCVHLGWLVLAWHITMTGWFYLVWLVAGVVLMYQFFLITRRERTAMMSAFKTNAWYGLLMWGALVLGFL